MLEADYSQVLPGSVSMGAKEDESNTGCVWAAGFQYVTTRSSLVHILKLTNCLFINFQIFWGAAVTRR
jgi:hypothetical protein